MVWATKTPLAESCHGSQESGRTALVGSPWILLPFDNKVEFKHIQTSLGNSRWFEYTIWGLQFETHLALFSFWFFLFFRNDIRVKSALSCFMSARPLLKIWKIKWATVCRVCVCELTDCPKPLIYIKALSLKVVSIIFPTVLWVQLLVTAMLFLRSGWWMCRRAFTKPHMNAAATASEWLHDRV